MSVSPEQSQQLVRRLGFIALVPFLAGVAGPWLFGSPGYQALPVFKLWSFTVLVFLCAMILGTVSQTNGRRLPAHLLVVVVLLSFGIAAMLLGNVGGGLFAGVAFLTFSHWLNWLWLQRTPSWQESTQDFKKITGRLYWVMLASHMLVLLNIIYLLRQA